MNRNDQAAIDGLFERLASVEATAAPRDPEAEDLIARRMQAQPGAAYRMAQTLVAQTEAMAAAEERIADLEAELHSARSDQGGFLSGLFGSAPPHPGVAAPRAPTRVSSIPSAGRRGAVAPAPGGQGGFLAGAAQTAMGVAGGVLLAQALTGVFSAGAAEAGTWPEAPDAGDPGGDDWDFDL